MPTQVRTPFRALAAAGLAAAVLLAPAVSSGSNSPLHETGMTFTGSYLAARSAAREQDMEAAESFLARVLRSDPDNTELIERTFVLRVINGDIDGSLSLAKRLVAKNADSGLPSMVLGIEQLKLGDYEKAEEHFRASLSRFGAPQAGPVAPLLAGLLTAWAQEGRNRTDAALATIDGLSGPQWYALFKDFHRALIADMAGRGSDAVKWMQSSFNADRATLRTVEGYARVLSRAGETERAREALSDFSTDAQEHPVTKALLAEIDSGKIPAPLVSTAQEGAAEALYSIGAAITGEDNNDIAAIYLELAVYLNPKDDLAWITLGGVRRTGRNYQKAIDAYSRVGVTSPLRDVAVVESSVSLDALEKPEEATAALKELLARDPTNVLASLALGDIYQRRKQYKEASEAYSIGIAAIDRPVRSHWHFFYSRGITYERQKRWPEAEADFRKALELNPDQPQVLNYLGYSLVDQGMKLEEALEMIKKAVEQRPEDAYIVDSLGWAYYKLGRIEDAVRELERAVSLQPEDPVINDHLGDAYWKIGRKREAIFQWTHARDLEPEEQELPKILAKLKGGLDAVPEGGTSPEPELDRQSQSGPPAAPAAPEGTPPDASP
jgi:tetratricopeptide (TPR) repeat protein